MSERQDRNKQSCWLTFTNEETHRIIRDNLDRAPMCNGTIQGVGPRYCPSIESKIVRFADKKRHQLFVEPEGEMTEEMYVQGMSTSLPADVQYAFLRTIPGLEDVKIMTASSLYLAPPKAGEVKMVDVSLQTANDKNAPIYADSMTDTAEQVFRLIRSVSR